MTDFEKEMNEICKNAQGDWNFLKNLLNRGNWNWYESDNKNLIRVKYNDEKWRFIKAMGEIISQSENY